MVKKFRNKETKEIVKAEIRYIPYPDTGNCDILLKHYYYELYISAFKKILFVKIEDLYSEWEEI